MKSFLLILLVFTVSCSGGYNGVDGPDTYTRDESIEIIQRAQIIRFNYCSDTESINNLLIDNLAKNPRFLLDGAFYSTKDVAECEQATLITPCSEPGYTCSMAPKEFLNGKLLQGGF
ncbi:hypothetical protein [Leptospira sp. GIMC2001]|uniref:hypothetical protein n=1 Tax=Leptospira sp. GIMC2001 TaxID=1513297 RepID=UPI002349BBDD|nr:hypothetical protein [Leptospira sp. GIMC2001]WCL49449.1 hypothetical protein O4O04_19500 [Leptospira sp. GIMC2001]